MYTLGIKHNIEIAHRLSLTEGKCEAIHGHSMNVELEISASKLDDKGLMAGLEFGAMKKTFRAYLDNTFDHRLLLNVSDKWAQPVTFVSEEGEPLAQLRMTYLPGLQTMIGDPTTENIATNIGLWCWNEWGHVHGYSNYTVTVWETATNKAVWRMG